ncbi:hypothetical protein V2J09_010155 [Rumex salicifolius]
MVQPFSKHATISNRKSLFRTCGLVFSVLIVVTFVGFRHFRNPRAFSEQSIDFPNSFLSLSSNSTVSYYLRSLTRHPHLAGSDSARQTARFVRTHFETLGLSTKSAEYRVLLSYPIRTSLSANSTREGNRVFGLSDSGRVVTPYHAYSPSGSAQGKAVFVNYGREEDYAALRVSGVSLAGCVAVARRGGGVSRGGVARIAAEHGVSAVLTYTEQVGFKNGVERGTVMRGIGDPLSPGWASEVEGAERLKRGDAAVKGRYPAIPSFPISEETAEFIVSSLDGGVGPGPTLLNFSFQAEEKMATIQDIFAVIEGYEEPDRYVLLGNHRDAWTYGAVDPNSGTAALLDIARRLAFLMQSGWRPRRTIVLCSWDAEEFGMIGSTEWVEQNLLNLGSKAVAYLNVDCAAQGPGFFAGATPQLDDLLVEVTKKVKDPESVSRTVYDQWTSANRGISIQRLSGVDSDFAPFLQHAGVPSIDMYYGKDFPVYHTAFDSYDWMDYASILSKVVKEQISIDPITKSIQHLLAAAKKINDEIKKLQGDDEASSDLHALNRRILNDMLMLAERALLDTDGVLTMEWFKHLVYGPSGVEGEHNLTAFPSVVNAIYRWKPPTKESDGQSMIQHEIWRVSRAIKRAADALNGL